MERPEKYTDITREMIVAWKKKHGTLVEQSIPLTDDPEGVCATFVVCKPTRKVFELVTEYGKDQNIKKVNNVLITNCVLGGDMKYITDEAYDAQVYLTLLETLGKLLEPRQTKSKYL